MEQLFLFGFMFQFKGFEFGSGNEGVRYSAITHIHGFKNKKWRVGSVALVAMPGDSLCGSSVARVPVSSGLWRKNPESLLHIETGWLGFPCKEPRGLFWFVVVWAS